jgi:hypothetical protein
MKTFEYKQEVVKENHIEQLNEEGKDGWKLVMQAMDIKVSRLAINQPPQAVPVFIFIREIEQ